MSSDTHSAVHSTIIVGIGNAIVMGASLLSTVLLMRHFPPSDYGIITTLISMMTVLPVFMDFGTTPSLIRLIPLLQARGDVLEKDKMLLAVFHLRSWIGIFLLFIGIILARPFATKYLLDIGFWSIVIALIGSMGVSYSQFISNIYQANERFGRMTAFRCIESMIRLIFVVCLIQFCPSCESTYAIIIYASAPIIAIILFITKIPMSYFRSRLDIPVLRKMINFSFWYMVSTVCLMVFMNFDIFILAFLFPSEQVGYFGAGFKFASFLYIIVHALNTVLMPKASKKLNYNEFLVILKKSIKISILIAVFVLPYLFFGNSIIHIFVGDQYLQAVPVFRLTVIDHAVMILFTPLMVVLLIINRPRLVAIVAACEMTLNIIGDLIVVPYHGGTGAAAVTLAVRVIVGALASLYLFRKMAKNSGYIFNFV